jgi:lactate permease
MTWKMSTLVPWLGDSVALSALMAAIPLLFLLWAFGIKRMKGHHASLIGTPLAIVVAIVAFGMPTKLALLATFQGMLFGLWPVAWIVVTAVFLYNLSVKMGQFDIIKNSLAAISDDRRLQALLIAFSFGAFLEGAAGFGAPVAITGAMLVGLGFEPLYAAGVCLIANTAPVAWGAIGIPIVVAGQVSGIDVMAVSQMVGRTLPFMSVIVPFYLVVLMAGWKKGMEVWPAALVCGLSFAISQWFCSNYISALLPDIIASLVSIICLTIFLKVWHPKNSWRFAHEPPATGKEKLRYTGGQIVRAWMPFVILSIFVGAWGIKSIKAALDSWLLVKVTIPGLDKAIIDLAGKPKPAVYMLNVLSAAGTGILFAAIVSIPVMGAPVGTAVKTFGNTLKTLKFSVLTISLMLGLAYIMTNSGMANSLGNALAATGSVFPFLAPFLGWMGVLMTGSDTSANALFGKLQEATATKLNIDPVITVAANTSGGVCGKMISPQSLAVSTAAVGLVGKESDIFRFTFKHSIILTTAIAAMVYMHTNVLSFLVPVYAKAGTAAAAALAKAAAPSVSEGAVWLAVMVGLSVVLAVISIAVGKGQPTPAAKVKAA